MHSLIAITYHQYKINIHNQYIINTYYQYYTLYTSIIYITYNQ